MHANNVRIELNNADLMKDFIGKTLKYRQKSYKTQITFSPQVKPPESSSGSCRERTCARLHSFQAAWNKNSQKIISKTYLNSL